MENKDINLNDYYNFGYVLVRLSDRASHMNADILPDKILSASNCICDLYPNIYFNDLYEIKNDEKINYIKDKISEGKFLSLSFIDLNSIRDFKQKFYNDIQDQNLKIISLNIHKDNLEEIIKEDRDYFWSKLELLDKKIPVDKTGEILGFEILGYEYSAESCHSYICNGLENDYKKQFGFQLNSNGFINSIIEAKKLSNYTCEDELGEPVYWMPMLIIEHSINIS